MIGLPTPTSTATKSNLHIPAGAHAMTQQECAFPVGHLISFQMLTASALQAYATTPDVATYNLKTLPGILAPDRKLIDQVRGYWLAAGYPASFPTVRDLDRLAAAADILIPAAAKADWPTVEKVYLPLNSAFQQYVNDADNELCPE